MLGIYQAVRCRKFEQANIERPRSFPNSESPSVTCPFANFVPNFVPNFVHNFGTADYRGQGNFRPERFVNDHRTKFVSSYHHAHKPKHRHYFAD
ncbi:hypothetical protein TWF679_008656 [Orbilia oligospora]|uniref:Uncharacterized protein n=1 Tax=Orbilia oligospora TaxID=2813651 RepID=A0A8H8V4F0_ORBOL|nr:hypothetical protein TWF679_008656 [Orbilia oligospora]